MGREAYSRAHLELVTIYEVGKILSSSLELARTFRETLNMLSAHMGFRRGMVILEQEDGMLHLFSAVGLAPEERSSAHYRSGEGIIGRVFASGTPVVIPDIAQEPLFLNRTGAADLDAEERIAFIGTAIKAGSEILGVLSVDRPVHGTGGGFREDLRLLAMVANLLGQALVMHRNVTSERDWLLEEAKRLRREAKGHYSVDKVVGISKPMQQVFAEVHQAAPSRATVLLRGESGTGKEVIARAIHDLSPRSSKPFIKLNCAALAESLLESELFGHEKGAFTGAVGERKGRFEQAHGGSLFLDEIGDISPAFQAKLLRVLQEREFERVGGSRSIKVDVRLIFATNRNLEKMVAEGQFRADLYYRINVVSIFLPPLRERREDIPPLIDYFLGRYNLENARCLQVSSDAFKVLTSCYWPGNVRELENCIERTATMTAGEVIQALNFPCHNNRCLTQMLHRLDEDDAVVPARISVRIPLVESPRPVPLPPLEVGEDKPEGERERLIWALEQCGWVQAKAARLLNITPRQLGYALQKHKVEIRKF